MQKGNRTNKPAFFLFLAAFLLISGYTTYALVSDSPRKPTTESEAVANKSANLKSFVEIVLPKLDQADADFIRPQIEREIARLDAQVELMNRNYLEKSQVGNKTRSKDNNGTPRAIDNSATSSSLLILKVAALSAPFVFGSDSQEKITVPLRLGPYRYDPDIQIDPIFARSILHAKDEAQVFSFIRSKDEAPSLDEALVQNESIDQDQTVHSREEASSTASSSEAGPESLTGTATTTETVEEGIIEQMSSISQDADIEVSTTVPVNEVQINDAQHE